MQRKGGSYYYVTGGERKWIPLGRDLRAAKARWAELEGGCTQESVALLLDDYLALQTGLKESSRKQYESWVRALKKEFGDRSADSVTMPQLALWRDQNASRPAWVNGCLAVLRSCYRKAVEHGRVTTNPCPGRLEAPSRTRVLTAAEFRRIRTAGVSWLRLAMDLSYLTGLRKSDVLGLRWSAVADGLYVRQQKTGTVQRYDLTPALASVLAACKARRVVGLFVIADDKGRQIKPGRLQENMRKACQRARVDDAHFHDIRALAGMDGEDEGLDAQALLGHSSRRQTEAYLRRARVLKVTPLRKRL